ncbi:MAG TPA: hypothetical protein VIJ95_18305 [Hanamia sp.]
MKKIKLFKAITILLFLSIMLNSCQAIGDIFKTGVWFGVIGIIIIILIIIWIIRKVGNKNA